MAGIVFFPFLYFPFSLSQRSRLIADGSPLNDLDESYIKQSLKKPREISAKVKIGGKLDNLYVGTLSRVIC